MPDSLKEASALVLASLSDDEINAVALDPKATVGIWKKLAGLGLVDSNRPLLTDCVSNTTYKDKPAGVEMVSWIAFMTAVEGKFGVGMIEAFKYRP